jgi:hypothetical protein
MNFLVLTAHGSELLMEIVPSLGYPVSWFTLAPHPAIIGDSGTYKE